METEQEVDELKEILDNSCVQESTSIVKGFKTKSGEIISWKEFFKRWSKGMKNLTPVQKTFNELISTTIILIGFIVGLVALVFFNKTFGAVTYGLILIFIGSVCSNILKFFALLSQLELFKDIERRTNGF
jgi:hypothetical protein